jgi:SAM-dependent methyltransferase
VTDSREINLAWWEERASAHAASPDYAFARFADDPRFLSNVVRFDVDRLGDVSGVRGVHLQCHVGTDTVSLSRLGARMTGLDFSPATVAEARRLARLAHADVDFVEGDVLDAAELLGAGGFDLVFTGVGALCWVPDIRRWAGVVAALLRDGGRLFLREAHPVLWSLDDIGEDGRLCVENPYFERPDPMVWDDPGTYVRTDAELTTTVTHEWNHGLGEIFTALRDAGLRVTDLEEHDSVPWEAFRGHMERVGGDEWRLADRPWRIPHSYTLQAVKA